MTQTLLRFALATSLVAMGCGDDDDAPVDTGADTSATDSGADAIEMDGGADTGTDTGGTDGGTDTGTDTGGADTDGTDTGTDAGVDCFNLSGATADLPFALIDTFDDSTPTWSRPEGETCPADALAADPVPFVAYTYCNDTGETKEFRFEALSEDDDVGMYIAAYAGGVVPEDTRMCAAANEPLLGIAEVLLILEPDDVVTIVSTLVTAEDTEVTSVAAPSE